MISLVGLLIVATILTALSVPRLRGVELHLPDHDSAQATAETQPVGQEMLGQPLSALGKAAS